MRIGNREIGPGESCFVVAEIGLNHNGSLETALEMVQAAQEAGADAVKVQAFSAACFTTDRATWQGQAQGDMFRRYELPREAFDSIAVECARRGLVFFGTPDCVEHAQWLIDVGAPCLKVGSDDLTNTPLLRQLARFGKPMILSSGMADEREVREALVAVSGVPATVLYCCSVYPARMDQLRFQWIRELKGFSDHTVGSTAAAVAVALGARIVEKHFTLSHDQEGPDHLWSADPSEFADLVATIRAVEKGLFDPSMDEAEMEMRRTARRSIVVAHDIPAGHVLTDCDVALKRPGDGLPPDCLDAVIGLRVRRDMLADEQVRLEDLEC